MEHKITALKLQKKNTQRVNVYLDGEFAFGLARIVAAWLQVGQLIDDQKIAELKAEDAREVAFQGALRLLNLRPRSALEIRQNLEKHGLGDDVILDVEERLLKSGLVDDARFARLWIENRSELRPRGKRALSYELTQRGIDRDTITRLLKDIDESDLAYRAAKSHYHKLKNLDWNDFRKKMYGFLSRRGFNYQISAPVVSRIWEEELDHKHSEKERQAVD